MSKPKHTPGPWKLIEERDSYLGDTSGSFAVHGQKGIIAVTDEMDREEAYANAALIAAAPEMLTALYWALHHITETHGLKDDEVSPILDAIAKAEGQKHD